MAKWFKTLWAASGDKTAVPDELDVSGAVSYTEGYNLNYERVLGTDPLARAIERQKLNYVLSDVTGALQQYQTHGFPDYIDATTNGGTAYAYAINAVVRFTDDKNYLNTVPANTDAPNVSGWVLHDDIASTVHAATAKTTPDDADEFGFLDSVASFVMKKMTWANIKASLIKRVTLVNNSIARVDGATGAVKDSMVTIDDNGVVVASKVIANGVELWRGGGNIYSNTASGVNALRDNTTGNYNTASGVNALRGNTTGNYNTANGANALLTNTTGIQNTASGVDALTTNTAGNYNTANGVGALRGNTTGTLNTASGVDALTTNTAGNYNTANGVGALRGNTTGNYNTANGVSALLTNTTGIQNTASGVDALTTNTAGIQNTASGVNALRGNTTGNYNTANGANALQYRQDGTNNDTYSNCAGLGYDTRVSGNNQVQLGNSSTTTYVYGTVQNRSDARDKTSIADTSLGLEFINRIRPVEYKWDMRDDYFDRVEETLTREVINEAFNQELEESSKNQRYTKEEYTQTSLVAVPKDGSRAKRRKHQGVIAQEVKAVMDELGVDFGGYQDHSINGGTDVLTIGYDEFIAPLIKAVQELSARVKHLEVEVQNATK